MSFLRSNIPKWVRNFPYELDKQALTNLAQSSKQPLDAPREMNFALYGFDKQKNITAAIDLIESKGWRCHTQRQADDPTKTLITATKTGYVLSEQNYAQDTAFFQRIAQMYDAGYDGWFASS